MASAEVGPGGGQVGPGGGEVHGGSAFLAGFPAFPQVIEYGGSLVEMCFGAGTGGEGFIGYCDWLAERGTTRHHWYLSDILTNVAKDEITGYGEVVYDDSGEGTYHDVPIVARGLLPEYGLCIRLNGSSQYVTLPSLASLADACTVVCVVKPSGAGANTTRCLIHTGPSGLYLGLNTTNKAVFGANGGTLVEAAHTVNSDEIYLLVGTHDGSGNARIYVAPAEGLDVVVGGPTAVAFTAHGIGEIGRNAAGNYYHGDIQGAAVLSEVLSLALVEALQATTVWTDVSSDVEIASPVSTNRGIHDDSPLARFAATSTAQFILDNSHLNSAGLEGYYSPEHVNARAGFDKGTPVRVSTPDPDDNHHIQFIGTVNSLKVGAGIYRDRRVGVTGTDWLDEAARATLSGLPIQANLRPENLIALLMNAMRHKPHAVNFQTGTDTYVRALHTSQDEKTLVAHELKKIVDSEYGWFYMRGDGTAVFEARHSRDGLLTADHTMTEVLEIDQERARNQIKNLVHTTTHPGRVDEAPVVLYSQVTESGSPQTSQPLKIGVGANLSIFLPFRSTLRDTLHGPPVRIGAIGIVPPEPTTDYLINAAEDGSGADLTTNPALTFVFRLGGNGVYLDITNAYGAEVWFTHLQILGRGVYDFQPIVAIKKDDALIRKHGEQLVSLDMPYQTDLAVAEAVGAGILASTTTSATRIRTLTFLHNQSTAMHTAGATGEIGQLADVSELMSGVDHQYHINGIRHEIGGEVSALGGSMSLIKTTWYPAPRILIEEEEPDPPVDSTIEFGHAFWGLYNGGTSNQWTVAPTTEGDNRFILIGVVTNGATDNLTSITYAGVNITANLVTKASPVIDGVQRQMYLFYLINPPVGTNSVVVTCGAVQGILGGYWICTGARQSSQPDNFALVTGTPATSFTSTLTPITDNSWVVVFGVGRSGSPPWSGPEHGTVQRFHDFAFGLWLFADNNGPVSPPALTSLTTHYNSNANAMWHIICSVAPSG